MSKILTPRNAAIGAGVVGVIAYLGSKRTAPIETFGSQNVANRFSAGGASKTHTPAIATKLGGDPDHVTSNQMNPKGIDSKHFKEHIVPQKAGESGGGAPFGKTLNESAYGHKDGK
ncbi:uncharacterized protein MYCFIDRAFT_56530 [Pseudocercospora fijiensis CIRAD86]|uniref:Uncharacterized protein n=1 Tax=Pseudocercospora fijiensis (strain CIRAD86) TaxID=383855 RepID=M2YQG9_PSEFD|nr:uncharacterized protein MYCFIDRAFT_56530 [Pseudocercospora fijiensis CIRAD86]EME79975.1 hypothetical protein MYCFIDRAFT_56530 [Pseudocercospora fijiensis CIRAD86]